MSSTWTSFCSLATSFFLHKYDPVASTPHQFETRQASFGSSMASFTHAIISVLLVAAVSGGNFGRRPGYGSNYGGGLRRGVRPGTGIGIGVRGIPGVGIGGVPGVGVGVPGVGVGVPGVGVGVPGVGVGGVTGSGLTAILPINKLNGGTYDPYSIWAADCNAGNYGHQRFMTGIWDDLNNFKDLDKVKCAGSAYGVTLNLQDNIVLDLQHGKHGLSQCPENYVMTAIFDIAFGFPHPSKAKCTRVTYGYLDNYDILTLYTDHKSGGPYDDYQLWNVECPPESAMVGIKKEYGRTVAINCAPLKRKY